MGLTLLSDELVPREGSVHSSVLIGFPNLHHLYPWSPNCQFYSMNHLYIPLKSVFKATFLKIPVFIGQSGSTAGRVLALQLTQVPYGTPYSPQARQE